MNKKSLFLIVVACTVISSAYAMMSTVQLSSEEMLKKYLEHGGFGSFIVDTNIHKTLGNRNIAPLELSKIVGIEVDYYNQCLRETAKNQQQGVGFEITSSTWIKKESVLKCILYGRSDVYNALLEHEEKLVNRQSKL